MDLISKNEIINDLLELYGVLLTEKQLEIMNMYYCYDLSLSEIAENTETSRAAVHDLIKRTSKSLEEYESKLKLREKREKIEEYISSLPEDIKQKIEELL